jgi:hypothetical protein
MAAVVIFFLAIILGALLYRMNRSGSLRQLKLTRMRSTLRQSAKIVPVQEESDRTTPSPRGRDEPAAVLAQVPAPPKLDMQPAPPPQLERKLTFSTQTLPAVAPRSPTGMHMTSHASLQLTSAFSPERMGSYSHVILPPIQGVSHSPPGSPLRPLSPNLWVPAPGLLASAMALQEGSEAYAQRSMAGTAGLGGSTSSLGATSSPAMSPGGRTTPEVGVFRPGSVRLILPAARDGQTRQLRPLQLTETGFVMDGQTAMAASIRSDTTTSPVNGAGVATSPSSLPTTPVGRLVPSPIGPPPQISPAARALLQKDREIAEATLAMLRTGRAMSSPASGFAPMAKSPPPSVRQATSSKSPPGSLPTSPPGAPGEKK